ncbi:hypothetical protein SFBNYU_008270 [Candidatus Arthromitus sp. SFB-mouse-NYU]|nr:hypothetical protein SFBNYU_008270 [Candidatus Arthromitus sp. SFB-mouse-NYU]
MDNDLDKNLTIDALLFFFLLKFISLFFVFVKLSNLDLEFISSLLLEILFIFF